MLKWLIKTDEGIFATYIVGCTQVLHKLDKNLVYHIVVLTS